MALILSLRKGRLEKTTLLAEGALLILWFTSDLEKPCGYEWF